jgi:hypothetical protein
MTTASTPPAKPRSALGAFLEERADWLRVEVTDGRNGGWDIAIVVDGTYYGDEMRPERMKAHFAELLATALIEDGVDVSRELVGQVDDDMRHQIHTARLRQIAGGNDGGQA